MSAEDDMAWPAGTTVIPADPPSPLRAAAQTVYDHHTGAVNHWDLDQHRCWEALRAALASPAPAGLDVLNEAICIVSETPTLGLADALTFRAAVLERLNALRAATRPAEDAGERP